MANLFIIGNGFDIDHKLPTKYKDFMEWLKPIAQGVDFDLMRNVVSKKITKNKEILKDITSIIKDAMTRSDFERCELLSKQINDDFKQINNWAYFNECDFENIKLHSSYTEDILKSVAPINLPFSRKKFVDNFSHFQEKFAEAQYKIRFGDYYEQFAIYRKKELDNSKLSTPISSFIFIELMNEIAGENWSNLEESLGKLNARKFIKQFYLKKDRINITDIASLIQFILFAFVSSLAFLNAWIYDMDISSADYKSDFAALIKNDDYFFSTNYTRTIENKYRVNKICHIHGTVRSLTRDDKFKKNDTLIFGHGNDTIEVQNNNVYLDLKGISNNALKKQTGICINKHSNFFYSLKNIEKVYSYGFSYGDVDMPYISKICSGIGDTSNVTWYLNEFDKHEHTKFKDKIRKNGFKGRFGTFLIKR